MAKQHYILGKRIARGGMAEIYLGKAMGQAAFQRLCAIKRILPHYSRDEEFVEMFRDEAHICKRLQHANIIQVYDFTEVEGSFALIMEYLEGADLRTLLSACEAAKTRLTIPMALYIAANTARGLHYAHTKTDEMSGSALGIVHRDVSPQNMMISYEGDVKVTDFGIASAETKATETRPGVVKGKYSYMSPEQVAAKPLDGRSDIFSLSIVLWETLAMRRLFAGVTEVESIRRVQNCEIPLDLRELNNDVDDELYQIVMKGLSADRKDRYQSAAAMEKSLWRYLHSRYADFTASELGDFLKRILAKRRQSSQQDIKETLMLVENNESSIEAYNFEEQLRQQKASQDLEKEPSRINDIELPIEPEIPQKEPLKLKLNELGTRIGRSQISTVNHTTQNHQIHMGVQKRPQIRQKGQNKKSRHWMTSALLGLALVGIGFFLIADYLFDKQFHVKIDTVPDRVAVTINNRPYKKGYISTPTTLSIQPGSHRIEISRPGYQAELINVSGRKRERKTLSKMFLKRLPGSKLIEVDLLANDMEVAANVNDGLYTGNLPMRIEVTPGVKHTILFIPENLPNRRTLKCSFSPASTRGIRPKLIIERETNGSYSCSMRE